MAGEKSSSSSKANLARIRDNQRRSRARRKEYMLELEAKWRVCEQLGVEASAEMQAAARKVLDENKRLRALLHRKGVPDDEIDAFALPASSSTPVSSMRGSPVPGELASPAPSAQLARMLVSRKPMSLGRHSPVPMGSPMSESLLDVSSAPIPHHVVNSSMSIHQPRPRLTPIIPFAGLAHSPQSIVSSTVSTPTDILSPEIFSSTPAPPSSDPGDYSHLQPGFAFSSSLDHSWQTYHSPVSATSVPDMGYTSCVDTSHMLRSMRPDVGMNLGADLGCANLVTECKVDSVAAYNVMDRCVQGTPPIMWD